MTYLFFIVLYFRANCTPSHSQLVLDLLDELINYSNDNPENHDLVTLATIFHQRLVWIPPFNDGNGRTVRLAMNLILMRGGYPPTFILTKDRRKYYCALNQANNGDYSKMLLLMFLAAERSLNLSLSAIAGDYEDYFPTGDIAEDPSVSYGQEYLSLLARRGRIDAYKEGRVWYTTKSAVEEYRQKKLK
ncbi:Fic family protein [Portibacter marinus]|uniref:Fic family protein n=1 Tax=Portibacter marinus TaxID=2898660 RepID=UPI001F30FA60|nr:Fic family protein [Portibacter marinus]